MVSDMLMPASVAEASLPASRIWTRMRLTRLADIYLANRRLKKLDARPTRVRTGL